MTEASCAAHRGLRPWPALCRAMRGLLMPPVLVFVLAVSAAAEPDPRITTDTAEYCGSLATRLASLPAARREPYRSLAAEGVKLCGNGHVRTGVAKLRRAIRAAQASATVMPSQ
jgi:hypothetical protein